VIVGVPVSTNGPSVVTNALEGKFCPEMKKCPVKVLFTAEAFGATRGLGDTDNVELVNVAVGLRF
jgi:hypothetical protein